MHYKKNFLTKVILRLDFGSIPALRGEAPTPEFSKLIEERYPHVIAKPTTTLSVNVGPEGTKVAQEVTGIIWEHRKSQESNRTVSLSHDFLSAEYGANEYEHFPEFLNDVGFLLEKFRALYQPASISRIGLRYINEIALNEGHPLDWDSLINPALIRGVMAVFDKDSMKMLRSAHVLHIKKDDLSLLFHYGLFNSEYPNPVSRRHFVLDYDGSVADQLPFDEVIATFTQLNKLCEDMFEQSIEDGLRAKMEVLNA